MTHKFFSRGLKKSNKQKFQSLTPPLKWEVFFPFPEKNSHENSLNLWGWCQGPGNGLVDTVWVESTEGAAGLPELFRCRAAKGTGDTCGGGRQGSRYTGNS